MATIGFATFLPMISWIFALLLTSCLAWPCGFASEHDTDNEAIVPTVLESLEHIRTKKKCVEPSQVSNYNIMSTY